MKLGEECTFNEYVACINYQARDYDGIVDAALVSILKEDGVCEYQFSVALLPNGSL